METSLKHVKMLAVIVEKVKGKKVLKILNDFELSSQVATLGSGTATEKLQSVLGFCETCKSVIFAIAPEDKVSEILQTLNEELHLDKPGTGIAFTIPIKSVSSMQALLFMLGENKEI